MRAKQLRRLWVLIGLSGLPSCAPVETAPSPPAGDLQRAAESGAGPRVEDDGPTSFTARVSADPARTFGGYSKLAVGAAARDRHIAPVSFEPPVPAPPPVGTDSGRVTPQTAAAQSVGITLGELEQLAMQHNPTLRQTSALVQESQGNWVQAGLYPNPTSGYLGSEIGNEGEEGQQGVFLSQDIVTAGKLELSRAAASWDVERSKWQAEAQRRRVLNGVRAGFYRALGAQETVTVAEELEQVARQGVEIARELLEGQQAPRTDVLQAEVELSGVEVLLRSAAQQEQSARRSLAAVAGISELPPTHLAGELADIPPETDFESDWQRIQASSPVLHMARAEYARACARLRREQVEPIPDLQLQGSVQQDFGTDSTIYGAQVGVELPIFDRNQGNIAAAAAAVRRSADEVARLELVLRRQLAEAHRGYGVARAQVELYRDSILPKSRETLELTTEGYRAGEVDFLRVLTARRSFIQNQVNYIAALTELHTSGIALEGLLLTGGLDSPGDSGTGQSSPDGGMSLPSGPASLGQ